MQRTVYSKQMGHRLTSNWNAHFSQLKIFLPYFDFTYREFSGRSCLFQSHGAIFNKNRIEEFKSCDKLALIQQEGNLIWKDIASGAILQRPSLLSRFIILSFGVRVRICIIFAINIIQVTIFFFLYLGLEGIHLLLLVRFSMSK